eukprot:9444056-Ditylum_brightwellii.AAC.1
MSLRAWRYVWRIMVRGRPTGRGLGCQAFMNFHGRRNSFMSAIFPIQRSCLLTAMYLIESTWNLS